jgi:hypothetical protein
MDEVTWIPTEMIDEVNPPLRSSPDDWITSLDDGAPALDNESDDERMPPMKLQDGQVVGFTSVTNYGAAQLVIRSPTDWTANPPMPAAARQVCAMLGWQLESLAGSVDGCVQNIMADEQGEPGEYELSYFTWSDDIPHRFDARTRHFKLAEPSNG